MKETIISPDSGLDAFRHTARSMIANAGTTRELATRMFIRDVRTMYRQSLLGYAWIFLPPIANTMIWIYLNQQKVISVDTGNVPYPLFVLTGNLLWLAFNSMVLGVLTALIEARTLIAKINIPHEALLISAFGKASLNAVAPFLLLFPTLLYYKVPLQSGLLLFPIGLLALLVLGAAFAVFLLPIATLYTDVSRAIQLLLRLAFFLTPVIYPLPKGGLAKFVSDINPVTPLLATARSWVIGDGPILTGPFIAIFLVSIVALILGVFIFKITVPYLVERLSA
ncbi:MAG: hypothetical protein AAFX93_05420 [Verrucomicrobiota bacterium]